MTVAVVTGAGAGIGRAIAERLAREGYAVMVNDLRLEAAQKVANAIEADGGKAMGVAGDVSSEADVDAMFARCENAFGPCTLLINNAGFVHQARFEDLTAENWDRMIAVHLRGTFLCARRAVDAMLAAGEGVIINVASQLGQIGGVELCHYSAAKAGIIGLTKAMARELSARDGIRVNGVAPGYIRTAQALSVQHSLGPEGLEQAADFIPMGRVGEPDDIADVIVFLASPAARYMTGQTVVVDGGLLVGRY